MMGTDNPKKVKHRYVIIWSFYHKAGIFNKDFSRGEVYNEKGVRIRVISYTFNHDLLNALSLRYKLANENRN